MADAEIAPRPLSRPTSVGFRDRAILWTSLAAITLIAWLYLLRMPMSAADLGGLVQPSLAIVPPTLVEGALTFMMWAVMMVAMMLPSASPMIETYATMINGRAATPWSRVALFTSGYLIVWSFFSAVATIAQILLQKVGVVTNAMTTVPLISAALLIIAGIYQVTPLKDLCLTGCRSPVGFFMTGWRDGASGALRMGLRHGLLCLGCCWMLMLLLFVFGVMNLIWIAALSVFVLLEKVLPRGRLIARGSGVAMIAAGIALLIF